MEPALLPNQMIVEPRFVEIDMMQVTHHSKYWIWFEESRWNFLEKILEISIKTFREQEILMPVVDCECKYKKPVLWNKPVILETKLEIIESSRFNFVYELFSKENRNLIFSTASTKHVFIEKDFSLKLQMPSFIKDKVNEMKVKKPFAFFSSVPEVSPILG